MAIVSYLLIVGDIKRVTLKKSVHASPPTAAAPVGA